jgi:lipoprotein NlpI
VDKQPDDQGFGSKLAWTTIVGQLGVHSAVNGTLTVSPLDYQSLDISSRRTRRCKFLRRLPKGDHDRASADYSKAIEIDPKDSTAYFLRGLADLYARTLPKAPGPTQSGERARFQIRLYGVLARHRQQAQQPAEPAGGAAKEIDMSKWPAPVIRLYLGQSIVQAGFPENEPDDNTEIAHICEGDFYRAELILQRGDKDKAAALFRAAAVVCPLDYVEHDGAVAELKALGDGAAH